MYAIAIKAVLAGLALAIPTVMAVSSSHAAEGSLPSKFGHQAESTKQLKKEHTITSKIVDVAEKISAKLNAGEDVDKNLVADMHDFFVNFVDACHHRKEEQYYFPAAVVAEPGLKSMVVTLKLHHDIGKSLLSGVERALVIWEENVRLARREAGENLLAYVTLLRRHIDVESEELFQPAEAAFTDQQSDLVRMGFHFVEAEELGDGFHEKYHALAMSILERAGK